MLFELLFLADTEGEIGALGGNLRENEGERGGTGYLVKFAACPFSTHC
jgi:hypothetical protein